MAEPRSDRLENFLIGVGCVSVIVAVLTFLLLHMDPYSGSHEIKMTDTQIGIDSMLPVDTCYPYNNDIYQCLKAHPELAR